MTLVNLWSILEALGLQADTSLKTMGDMTSLMSTYQHRGRERLVSFFSLVCPALTYSGIGLISFKVEHILDEHCFLYHHSVSDSAEELASVRAPESLRSMVRLASAGEFPLKKPASRLSRPSHIHSWSALNFEVEMLGQKQAQVCATSIIYHLSLYQSPVFNGRFGSRMILYHITSASITQFVCFLWVSMIEFLRIPHPSSSLIWASGRTVSRLILTRF